MVDFIHNNKDLYGVDAICRILPIAASTGFVAQRFEMQSAPN